MVSEGAEATGQAAHGVKSAAEALGAQAERRRSQRAEYRPGSPVIDGMLRRSVSAAVLMLVAGLIAGCVYEAAPPPPPPGYYYAPGYYSPGYYGPSYYGPPAYGSVGVFFGGGHGHWR